MTASHQNFVAATYVQLLYDYLGKRGMDAQRLLGPMPVDSTRHGLERVPLSFWQQALSRASEALDDPALGLHLGQTITPGHFGLLGYVVLNCETLAQAMARMERYHRLVYDVNPATIEYHGNQILIRWGVERGRPGRLVDEAGITAIVQLARNLTGQAHAIHKVGFVNPPPKAMEPYQDYFGGQVRFDQPYTLVQLSMADAMLPLRAPDAGLLSLLDDQAETLLARHQDEGVVSPFRAALVSLMREGKPTLAALAEHHHISARTLQRRLDRDGLSFQQLLDNTRYQLAQEYLRDPRLELTEVACLLGYSEQSAFSRAFKQWTGESPARWRKRLGAAD